MDEGQRATDAYHSPAQQREEPGFVLVHSPLLGPATWLQVAQELKRREHEAIVPSLRGIVGAAEPQWRYVTSAVRAATVGIDSPIILIAHAGAGRLLPAIARSLPTPVVALIFVDACLPPPTGRATLAPTSFLAQVRALKRDGLEPSSSWFRQELPPEIDLERATLAAVLQERPRLPLSYFQERVPMPERWTERGCAYLCLSDAYAESASQAQIYGWPVAALPGAHHLAMVTDPEAVTSVLLNLAEELYPTPLPPTGHNPVWGTEVLTTTDPVGSQIPVRVGAPSQ
jgi:Alpha/beta hydrolase family